MMKVVIIISLLLPTFLFAQTWRTESGEQQLAVLELFTSEGCGLCPAADRWVHDLPKKGITDQQLIVLGFHIDYLNDKKGWIDRFASPIFTNRQRQLAQINLYKTVYTPEFVVSGEVIHNWKKHVIEVVNAVNDFEPEVKIGLTVEDKDKELIIDNHIIVQGNENRHYSKLYIAVTEDDLISKVSGGDNAGTTFNHQNLVRQWLGPFSLDKSGESKVSTTIKINDKWDKNKIKIVALVQNLNDGFVLQAVSLTLGDEKN